MFFRKIKKGLYFISSFSIIKTVYWRIRLKLPREASLHIYPKSIVSIAPSASFSIKGEFAINESWFNTRRRRYTSEFILSENATCICNGDFKLFQGASIYVAPGATLVLHGGWSFLNTNSTLNCFHRIEIGEQCAISDNVSITDSDSHYLGDHRDRMISPVIIGNHVWIGKNVTILKGVSIGDGAIVGAGSVVTRDIPTKCLAVGNPARIIKENIEWK